MTDLSDKPKHVPDQSQAQLRAIYNQHNFAALLTQCDEIPIIPLRRRKPEDTFHSSTTEFEQGTKFRDKTTGHTIAVIFWYTDIEGDVTEVILSLRVGDTIYDAAVH